MFGNDIKVCRAMSAGKEIEYKLITKEAADLLMSFFDDDELGRWMPKERFLWQEDGKWIALDNEDANAWIEEFDVKLDAVRWLIGEED